MLEAACADARALLQDWIESWMSLLRPREDGPLAKVVPDAAHFAEFLGPALTAVLDRASQAGRPIDPALVYDARAALEATTRWHRPLKRRQLFDIAGARLRTLRNETCRVARELDGRKPDAQTATRAREVLRKVAGVLTGLLLAMGGVGPNDFVANLSDWGHEVAKVLALHQIAMAAQPERQMDVIELGGREL